MAVACPWQHVHVTTTTLSWDVVPVDKPDDVNVVIGQAHFIKTVEDLHEAMVGVRSSLRFGLAFRKASGPRLVRRTGNDPELVELATRNALAIAAGHCFVIFLRDGFPVNILNPVKAVPEVCTIHCATANPVDILVAVTPRGRGIVGVVDGQAPLGWSRSRRGRPARPAARHRLQALTAPRAERGEFRTVISGSCRSMQWWQFRSTRCKA